MGTLDGLAPNFPTSADKSVIYFFGDNEDSILLLLTSILMKYFLPTKFFVQNWLHGKIFRDEISLV